VLQNTGLFIMEIRDLEYDLYPGVGILNAAVTPLVTLFVFQ